MPHDLPVSFLHDEGILDELSEYALQHIRHSKVDLLEDECSAVFCTAQAVRHDGLETVLHESDFLRQGPLLGILVDRLHKAGDPECRAYELYVIGLP